MNKSDQIESLIDDSEFDYEFVARATSGYTGAELRRLMSDTANSVSRLRRNNSNSNKLLKMTADDVFRVIAAREEAESWAGTSGHLASFSPDLRIKYMSDEFKKGAAVYEAGKVLLTFMLGGTKSRKKDSDHDENETDDSVLLFDDVNKSILFPQGSMRHKTYFLPQQQYMDTGTYTREYIESKLVSLMAGVAAQELVLGRFNMVRKYWD